MSEMSGYAVAPGATPEQVEEAHEAYAKWKAEPPRMPKRMLGKWVPLPGPEFYLVEGKCSRLSVGVTQSSAGSEFMVIALESPLEAVSAKAIFDAHAHKIIGTRKTVVSAKKLGETYARKWKASQPKTKRCDCKTIKTKKVANG